MQRVAFVMRVKEGQQEEYIRRHQEVWQEVLVDLQRAGVRKMSIFMSGLQLFLYMEVKDYAASPLAFWRRVMISVRWERIHGTDHGKCDRRCLRSLLTLIPKVYLRCFTGKSIERRSTSQSLGKHL